MKILVHVATNKVGSRCERVIEVDDEDAEDPSVLEDIARDVMFEMISWGYSTPSLLTPDVGSTK